MTAAVTDIAAWLNDRRAAMTAFLADLVRIPSENPPGAQYAECVDRIEHECRALGLSMGRPVSDQIVEATYGLGDRILYFSGHYDVVPAQSTTQFEVREHDGLLYGRGSSDMKGGLVAMIYAVAALAARRIELDGTIILRCVPDEETGGRNGTALLAEAGAIAPGAIGMVTPEPTGGVVWNSSRGAITWRITTIGRAAHVGLHYQGVSAFDAMLDVVRELKVLGAEIAGRRTASNTGDDAGRHSILLIGGRVACGDNFNVVPGTCTFTIDRRINPEESLAEERARLVEVIERVRASGVDVRVEVLQEGDASNTSEQSEVARALSAAVASVRGTAPQFELCPGLLETRFYSQRGIPALAYGPGDLSMSHGPDEFIDVQRMVDAAAIYARTAVMMLGSQVPIAAGGSPRA